MSLGRGVRAAVIVGMGALGTVAAMGAVNRERFFPAYLFAWLFWLAIAAGSHALSMLHHLTGGRWGYAIHRPLDAAARTLPLLAAAFVPVLLGLDVLYPWARPETVAHDPILQHRAIWMNVPFFIVRAAVCFLIWIGLSTVLDRWSMQLERSFDPALERRRRVLSAVGIAAYGLSITFAMFDWVMSLDAHWYSTIFGMIFMAGQGLSAMAFAVLAALLVARRGGSGAVAPGTLNDLGNLMLAFVMVWAYLSFSQFLIIWSGNIPEEIVWFADRTRGGWQVLAVSLLAFQFALPFLLLLSRRSKRRAEILVRIAVILLAMRLVDLYWTVQPVFSPRRIDLHPAALAAPAGLGGLWVALFLVLLFRRPLAPRAEVEEAPGAHPAAAR
ncbi:MAG TPA: hypothetical protein VJV23_03600 [Candidatus Polarisedimenticolia bacterium]|nr:hypothetical protein [Candidatus Polarisedimenticolia bacterium]